MNKADSYYKENLRKIMEEGSWDKNPRPKYSDGVNAYTKFITGVLEEYDISKGEYPIPTLRNTAIKTGIKEIMWIYQKQTSSLSSFIVTGKHYPLGGSCYGFTCRKTTFTAYKTFKK